MLETEHQGKWLSRSCVMVHSHTRWDGMGWTEFISSHPTPACVWMHFKTPLSSSSDNMCDLNTEDQRTAVEFTTQSEKN